MKIATALTIAGSDSGGGAGIQADLKTFAALEVHGLSAITAITAQSTVEVRAIHSVPVDMIAAQLDTVLDDFEVGAAKTGMIHSAEIISTIVGVIRRRELRVVVDPVMIAESGAALLEPSAIHALVSELVPCAEVLTPNIPEAEALLGRKIGPLEDRVAAGHALRALGARAVLVKGGHAAGPPTDVFVDARGVVHVFEAARIATTSTHGTGCTYAAAIAALLARGEPVVRAVERAHAYVHGAIAAAPRQPVLGRGHGPVHHLHPWYRWGG
ncbi:bifunctional hydroxymethylpyrimidine kinase/phosphomethylpyrimidine kinase [Myxococcota bacterium]|nr:bifunctional hydroxymethylpyrimidine kinase/phosphomethylpyrimidine kinase [Myxococcota bacterium]